MHVLGSIPIWYLFDCAKAFHQDISDSLVMIDMVGGGPPPKFPEEFVDYWTEGLEVLL